jgi:signal transduction histidine kinase
VPLCLLALAGTAPLVLRRPVAAAVTVTVTVAVAVMLAWVRQAPAAGAIAVLLAAFRLGTVPPGTRSPGRGPLAAIVVAAAFAVMALAVPVLTDTLAEHLARGERARIARELHDVVAHHISVIAVRAEAARLTTPGMPEAGAQRLREIGDTARAGLAEMRRLLGVLREDVCGDTAAGRQPQPGLPQVATLAEEARQAGGSAVRLIVSGPVTPFDPGVELVAYRIVQEALTNARRHAPGAAVDVELRYDDDMLRLRIRDNGPGPELPVAGGVPGHGLPGMRERAATVGGRVRTGAALGGGFLVEAVLPAKPDEAGHGR